MPIYEHTNILENMNIWFVYKYKFMKVQMYECILLNWSLALTQYEFRLFKLYMQILSHWKYNFLRR